MVRKALLGLLVCLHAAAFHGHSQELAPTPKLPPVSPRDALQASDGAVWVIADDGLFWTDGDQWEEARLSKNVGDRALVLGRGPGGSVVSLSEHRESGQYAICTETPSGGTVKAVLLAKQLRNPQILGTRDGGYIVTEQGPRIFYCAPGSTEAKLIYTIEPEQCVRRGRPAKESSSWNPICAVEDAKKRIWIYSNVLAGSLNNASLRGVLLIEGGTTRHVPIIPGLADRPLSVLTPMDDQVFWAAVPEDGLYQVYVDELRADPVPEPAPQAFSGIQRIVSTKDAWWFVSRPLVEPKTIGDGITGYALITPIAQTVLWRLPKGGDKITVVLDDLDEDPVGSWAVRRPIVETPDGTLIGSLGRGLWFVPKSGEPVLFDWRVGFPLLNSERVFLLSNSRFMAVDFGQAVHVGVHQPIPEPQPAPGIIEHTFINRIARDAHGHFWAFPAGKQSVLAEWDGEKWREHALPEGLEAGWDTWVAVDQQQRVWVLSDSLKDSVGWFDKVKEKWTTFPNLREGLQSLANQPKHFGFSDTLRFPPAFSGDGRIVYANYWTTVNYFDGQRWREWSGNFLGKEVSGEPSLPFFNNDGLLCINRGRTTFAFTEEKGWYQTTYQERPEFEPYLDYETTAPSPVIGEKRYESNVIDVNTGDWWFTEGGQLYKANLDMYSPIFAPGENHPFLDGRRIYRAETDPIGRGGVFFLTTQESFNTYVQLLPPAAPETSATLVCTPEGELKVQFSAANDTRVSFQWQLDDRQWSQPSKETEFVLPPLTLGAHRLKVRAIDRFLTPDSTPAEVPIEVAAPPLPNGSVLLNQLLSGDPTARDYASKELTKLGSEAIPALREARITADKDTCWWIDATLQEIERMENIRKNPPKRANNGVPSVAPAVMAEPIIPGL